MITVRLTGGLGNQMFQYAVGKWLAEKWGTRLTLETSLCNTTRPYKLWYFSIDANPIAGYLSGVARAFIHTTYQEQSYAYDPEITNIRDNTYLKGYWQSEKYFKDIYLDLLSDFRYKEKATGLNKVMEDQIIGDDNSVSLHIRRGDYVGNNYHPLLPDKYYREAIGYIARKIDNPHFYIFSDDMAWVKKNFKIRYDATFIDFNGPEKDYDDLRLMRHCQHHIIANSSFSWWGAWLSWNPGKIVIAPKRWFTDPSINTDDLIPNGWLRT